MPSIREQITSRVVAALINATSVGDRVFRSREAALAREEASAIIVAPDSEDSDVFSGGNVDQNTFDFEVEISVRGDPWDSIADPIAVDAHRTLMRDAQLQALVTRMRKTGTTWQAKEADQTAGALTMKYQCRYLSAADDIAAAI